MLTNNSGDRKIAMAVVSYSGTKTTLEGVVSTHRPFEGINYSDLKGLGIKYSQKNLDKAMRRQSAAKPDFEIQVIKTIFQDHIEDYPQNRKVLKMVTGLEPKLKNGKMQWPLISNEERIYCTLLEQALDKAYACREITIKVTMYGKLETSKTFKF